MPEEQQPVSLIPEQQKERGFARATATSFKKPGLALSSKFLIFLLFLVVASAAWFLWQLRSLEATETSLERTLQQERGRRDAELEKKLFQTNAVLAAFDSIASEHRRWTQLFERIQERALADIIVSGFEGSYATGVLRIQGTSPTYGDLARQVKAFELESLVDQVNILRIQTNTEGLAEFEIEVLFQKSILQ